MKTKIITVTLSLFILLINFSCTKHEPQEENPEVINNPKLREKVGGEPEESSTIVASSFHSPDMNCAKGFGICYLEFTQPIDQTQTSRINEKKYNATVYLGTGADILKIEFNEEVPHFDSTFTVKLKDTLKNVLGHEYIIPVEGNYKPVKNANSQFGNVEIKVIKGKEKTAYPVEEKDKEEK